MPSWHLETTKVTSNKSLTKVLQRGNLSTHIIAKTTWLMEPLAN